MKKYKIYKESSTARPQQVVLFSLSDQMVISNFRVDITYYKLLGIQRYHNGYNDTVKVGGFYFIEDKNYWDEEELEFNTNEDAIFWFKLQYPNGETV